MITNLTIGQNGRLGNQIFQYAILKVISKIKGHEVILPEDNLKNYTVGRFNVSINKKDFYKLELYECFDINEKILPKSEIIKNIKFSFNEPFEIGYHENILNAPDNTNFNGFFICNDYYKNHKTYLKNTLKFKQNIKDYTENILNALKEKNNAKTVTTVHVRRGDNVLDAGKYYFFLTEKYYNKLFEKNRNKENIFVVVSDDIKWCKENFKGDDIFFYDVEERKNISQDFIMDFYLLSLGDKIIMSNSTFSWWAAWLSDAQEVYCPDKWMGYEYTRIKEEFFKDSSWLLEKSE